MKYLIFLVMMLTVKIGLKAQNIGIGTNSPTEKLHVADGQIRLSRTIDASNNIIFNMPPGDILTPETQGLLFKIDNATEAAITHTHNSLSGSILRFSQSTSTANDLVIDENGSVGLGTSNPGNSALLDMTSTSKGVLVPRMTKTNRDAISSPATALLIYQTNETPGFYYNAGTSASPNWANIAKRVDTLSFGAEAFFPRSSSSTYVTDAHSARYINIDGNTDILSATINFPSGVTIKQMKVFFYDESASFNLRFSLYENYLAQGVANATDFEYTSSGSATGVRTATINDNHLVQNGLYSYHIKAWPSGGSWSGSDIKIKGVMIVYEY